MQEAQLPPSRWDDGKDSCGKARKLGLPHKGQGMLAMGKRNLLQPLPQLLCLGENVGTAIARAVPELPAQSSGGAAGGERRQRGNGEVLAGARCAGETQPAHCLPRSAASWQGPRGGTFFGGGNKAQQSLPIFKLSA